MSQNGSIVVDTLLYKNETTHTLSNPTQAAIKLQEKCTQQDISIHLLVLYQKLSNICIPLKVYVVDEC
jgi:hypothetical protein